MVNVPKLKLNNGTEIPQVGFGLWKITENTADVVYNAIKVGYRLLDGAFDYGNEKGAGEGVKRAIDEGIVKREDLTIVSKLWNTFHEKERVEPIARQQLKWWGIDYFDVFYIHFPIALEYVDPDVSYPSGWTNLEGKVSQSKVPLQETYEAMEHLVDIGLVKTIGVSNYQGGLLLDLLRYARIRPSLLQVEIHPYLSQEPLVKFAQSEGIVVNAYSSLGPQSFIEMQWTKALDCPKLFEHNVIKSIATKHKKSVVQVLLRWATQRGLVVIPKVKRVSLMVENLESTDLQLDDEDMEAIFALNQNLRFNNPVDYLETPLYIFA